MSKLRMPLGVEILENRDCPSNYFSRSIVHDVRTPRLYGPFLPTTQIVSQAPPPVTTIIPEALLVAPDEPAPVTPPSSAPLGDQSFLPTASDSAVPPNSTFTITVTGVSAGSTVGASFGLNFDQTQVAFVGISDVSARNFVGAQQIGNQVRAAWASINANFAADGVALLTVTFVALPTFTGATFIVQPLVTPSGWTSVGGSVTVGNVSGEPVAHGLPSLANQVVGAGSNVQDGGMLYNGIPPASLVAFFTSLKNH